MPKNPERSLTLALTAADDLVASTSESKTENIVVARLLLQKARIVTTNKQYARKHDKRLAKLQGEIKALRAEVTSLKSLALAQEDVRVTQATQVSPVRPLTEVEQAMKVKTDIDERV